MMRLIIMVLIASGTMMAQTFNYDFSNGFDGWTGDFADYPKSDSIFYQLSFSREKLPQPLDTNKYGLYFVGSNHSDDLIMFMKRKIDGLMPNTNYDVTFNLIMASNVPTNAVGAGGPPGEAVVIKIGVTQIEPIKVLNEADYYRMNIDVGNQGQNGADSDTLGHIGVSDTTKVYTLIERSNYNRPFQFSTDNNGVAWIFIGTDSGFEGITRLYYTDITIDFDISTSVSEPEDKHTIFPNPVVNSLQVDDLAFNESFVITNLLGQKITSGNYNGIIDVSTLENGLYYINFPKSRRYYKFIKE